jgi:hypothetical protein
MFWASSHLSNMAEKSADGFDHVRLLGDNKVAFKDLWSRDDGDYSDLIVKVSIVLLMYKISSLPRFNSS